MSDLAETIHTSLVKSRHNLLFDALPLFDGKRDSERTLLAVVSLLRIGPHLFPETKLYSVNGKESYSPELQALLATAAAADPSLAMVMRNVETGEATTEEEQQLSRYIDAIREHEAATAPRTDASTSTSTPALIPSIVVEFKESAPEMYILPSHFIFDLLPLVPDSPHPTQQPVLLSFFVASSETRKGKERAVEPEIEKDLENGETVDVLIPFSLILDGLDDVAKNTLYQASRTARPRDDQVESWWKKSIAAAPPRVHITRTFDPPELPPEEIYEQSPAIVSNARPRFGTAVSNASGRSSSPATAPKSNRRKPVKKRARPRAPSVRSRLSTTFPGDDVSDSPIITTRRASRPSAKAILAANSYEESDEEERRPRRESPGFEVDEFVE